jgi:hypothetical protein
VVVMLARRSIPLAIGLTVVACLAGPAAPAGASLRNPVPCPGCWRAAPGTSWQWQLQGRVNTGFDVAMYDIDGFEASRSLVRTLHRDGRAVVCYLSAGSWERYRPDADEFPSSVIGRSNGWPGERWLDIRRLRILRPIMRARIAMCARKRFDGVEFDNVDGYENRTGFPLGARDQLRYDVWLANAAHRAGLSVALKNDVDQARTLEPYFDYALDEECFTYDECDRLTAFVNDGKAVFGVEYALPRSAFCPEAAALGFDFMRKRLSLRAWRRPCPS